MNPQHDTPEATAAALIAAVNDALVAPAPVPPAVYRDTTPLPVTGTTPPVVQPGRPPMSQGATDTSVKMLAGGAGVLMAGGGVALPLVALAGVDPLTLALFGGASASALLALSRLVRRTKEAVQAAPATHHHHYAGPVVQDHSHTEYTATSRGLVARSQAQGGTTPAA
ncbi:hypothetical protein [Streptomyces laurentii]|uniref:hypothetical protein n=1 Tax=Streptomyces laurentii TaxID=39478 RepID=UPI00368500A9